MKKPTIKDLIAKIEALEAKIAALELKTHVTEVHNHYHSALLTNVLPLPNTPYDPFKVTYGPVTPYFGNTQAQQGINLANRIDCQTSGGVS